MSGSTFPAFASARRLPNLFDIAAALCIGGLIFVVASGARQTVVPLDARTPISLDPAYLPGYALRTTLRMFAALACSLLFTFTYATWAAKSRRAGLVLVPVLDILQSVPIIGFLTFTVVFFMGLFPGQVLGAELAAIFAIFTSQAWNMAFSLYQSLKTVPADLDEAPARFRLSPWQRFWRMEVPFAMPGLVWNTMMSMSGGWFFVVASEAVTVGDTTCKLPGIGSYVALALEKRDIRPCSTPSWRCWWSSWPTTSCCSARWSPGPQVPLRDDRAGRGRGPVDAEAAAPHAAAAPAWTRSARCSTR